MNVLKSARQSFFWQNCSAKFSTKFEDRKLGSNFCTNVLVENLHPHRIIASSLNILHLLKFILAKVPAKLTLTRRRKGGGPELYHLREIILDEVTPQRTKRTHHNPSRLNLAWGQFTTLTATLQKILRQCEQGFSFGERNPKRTLMKPTDDGSQGVPRLKI